MIQLTEKQAKQFNLMLGALNRIAKEFQTPAKLRKGSQKDWGLDYEEALEMAYENLQSLAKTVSKGVKPIKLNS